MRNAFAAEINALAAEDPRIVMLSGDIGNRLFDSYKAAFGERFFNCGVAEANMLGVAAGMALSGLRPVAYTITPFITTRCYEQIRIDVCYHNVPVVIVGVGAGLSYASLGATHHACEDIAMMRILPNMTVVCPADAVEVRLALRAAIAHNGPVYLRLGKKGEPVVHQQPPDFKIGQGIVMQTGTDGCLLSTGTMLPVAMEAAAELAQRNISVEVVSMHTVKPLDDRFLMDIFKRYRMVATIEEHSILGGLGGSVAEWLSDHPYPDDTYLCRIGTPDSFIHEAGEQAYAREQTGLTARDITDTVSRIFQHFL